ncbi:hypothetical protein [Streptomyces marincola]|uniref:hypothetical protein n=1 Tax=Streptomyces marincola TaxID=2878388 RepID=UPI001CF44E63|nr:hypothetical protein [Streptomyces marincola]UCM90233.1 hypothetical protein LC193_21100 [Streptomyces marincola]
MHAYTRAYFAGEAVTAYAMLSERCRDLVGSSAHGDEVAGAAAEHGELTVQTYTTNLIEADSAVVTYTVGVPELDEPRRAESWVSENRSWKWDAC